MAVEANKLLETCDATVTAGRDSLDWFQDNGELVRHDAVQINRAFRRHVMAARKMRTAIERPMCVGVFGASQAGKSYLISALARKGTNPLTTTLGGKRMDYLADINPEGGKEATGLVTRFTVRPVPALPDAPVSLRLLTETDIIKILGNSYLADVDHSTVDPPDGEVISALMDTLRGRMKTAPVDRLTEDDVFDLQEYFDRTFGGVERVKALRVSYWEAAAELAPYLEIADRATLFAILWDDLSAFTDVYVRLQKALAQLGFPSEACCGLEGLQPRNQSIINVDTLHDLGQPNAAGTVTLRSLNGQSATVSRADATALIAELAIQIDEQPWDFFEHTDLLDFPGARARESIRDIHGYLADSSKVWVFFLRGKVAYLYERYCADQELTSMLLCVGPSNQEVVTLPAMVKSWIEATHGERPEDRAKQDTALFLVLTKFDMEFADKKGSDKTDLSTRWTTRLEASFLHFFGKQDTWPYEWDGKNRPFQNIFWVRNPNIKDEALLDYDESDHEIGIRATAQDRIAKLKAGYIQNGEVQTYVGEAELKWDAAMKLNDGGIGLLAERLRPVCRPELKLRQIEGRLSDLRERMGQRLKAYYVSGDREAERLKRRQELEDTVIPCLIDCMEATRFGVLQRRLMVEAKDMERVFKQMRFRFSRPRAPDQPAAPTSAPAPRPRGFGMNLRDRVKPSPGNGNGHGDGHGTGAPDGEDAGKPAATNGHDSASAFVDAVLQAWAAQIRDFAQDAQACQYFLFNPTAFDTLVNELLIGSERLAIADSAAETLRDWMRLSIDSHQTAPGAGIIAANAVNGYLRSLGFDGREEARRPRVAEGDGERPIFPKRPDSGPLRLGEDPLPYDMNYCLDWIEAIRVLTEENASGGTDANTPSNRTLGGILAALGAVPAPVRDAAHD
ncbi:hypothetical protein F1188_18410 [Roseospira marina]|uniref:Virulence factor n=1 Tax=Roseospira marina TaxID=140057 RepID=A0A5M6I841_9PROT|nr:virulence factor SrfC family protein [Roseospira marina]KAA5603909.1 hypothetical protein F1188_18410 [Roseospira marina]MBB4315970.1 hypothetical protein [Roseospira marina]MBB5089160.1 hypothetical protein [Roseospira marina]